MNKTLQKWAERKVKILKKWSKEYHKLLVKEGIEEGPIVSMAFDGDYVSSIHAMVNINADEEEYLIDTKASFKHNGKWS